MRARCQPQQAMNVMHDQSPGDAPALLAAGCRTAKPPAMLLDTAKLGPVSESEPVPTTDAAAPEAQARLPAPLEEFLAAIDARAFRFAEIALRNRDDALDAVQDAMMKMLVYRDRAPSEWNPLFWSILRNRIVDLQRRGLFRLRWLVPGSSNDDGEPLDWADDSPDPARSNDSREAWLRISTALRALPTRQREAFTLRVLEELDVADTASAMGCSEGSVKTHLSRAREALQKQLEEFR